MTSIMTNNGVKLIMDRAYEPTPNFTAPTVFKVGTGQATPVATDTDLTTAVPISNGTVNDDGDNTLTGSSGGDNSTDNTTTFKPGAGQSDVTSQNLIANNTNVSKIWTISNLASLGVIITGTKPFGLWIYIKDSTALAKLKTSGTAIEIKLGSSSANYYSKTFAVSVLVVGWNWLTSGTTAVNALSETGTVSGDIDFFIITATTNSGTDTFIAGDFLYDLLRQWVPGDLTKTINASYPIIDNTALTVEIRSDLGSTQANGFNLNGYGLFNTDGSELSEGIDSFTSESKTDTDEFIFTTKNQFIANN